MWKIALPSVKCSRLCLCTRLLIESATVDFFLNLQKVSLVMLNKKHQQQRMMPLSWPPTQSQTCLQCSSTPCHLTTHKNFSTAHRELGQHGPLGMCLLPFVHRIYLDEREGQGGVLIYFVCEWVNMGAKVGAQLTQTTAVQPSPMGTFLQCLNIVNNFQALQNQDYR